jgi:O-antigen ligase
VYALVSHGRAVVPRHRMHVLVAAVIAASALSALFAADRYVALFGDAEIYQGFTFVIDMTLLYLAAAIAVRAEGDVAVILGATMSAGAIAIAYGMAQAIGWDPFAWASDPRSRPFATFGNADHFGHFLSVFFGIALGLVIASRASPLRLLAAAGIVAALAMVAIVATRATILGMGGSLIVAALVRRPSPRTIAYSAVAVLGAAVAFWVTPLGERIVSGGAVADRLQLYDVALRATLARPVLGYGTDNFRAAFAANRTVESLPLLGPGPQATAHSWFLDVSATTGIVGLAAVLAFIAVGTIELWRLAKAHPRVGIPLLLGWAAYWADGLVAAASLAAVWFPWLALGVAVGLRGARGSPAQRRVPIWIAVVLGVVAVVAAATGARSWQANRDAWSAEEATQAGDPAEAVTFADRATARDEGRADNWNRLGLAYEAIGRDGDAVDAYREAARREPYEAVYWANLGRGIARGAGSNATQRHEAIDAARQGTIVDPNSPIGHAALAEIATAFGRCDLARAEAARAAALENGHDELLQRAANCR